MAASISNYSSRLVFTVAVKREIPVGWLEERGVGVFDIKRLKAEGARIAKGPVLAVITGVGRRASHDAAIWIRDNLSPFAIVNLGTAASITPDCGLGDWVMPDISVGDDGGDLRLETTLPFHWPESIRLKRGGAIYSASEPVLSAAAIPVANVGFVDMESRSQAEIFCNSSIPFHVIKSISDLAGPDAASQYEASLDALRDSVKIAFGFVERRADQDVSRQTPSSSMKTERMSLAEIEADRSLYRFNRNADWIDGDPYNALLMRSFRESGIRNPVLVHRRSNGENHLFDGFLRYAFCRRFGVEELACAIFEDLSILEILDIVLIDHFGDIIDAAAVSARFVSFAAKLGATRSEIAKRYLPMLGLDPHESAVDRCEAICGVPDEILRYFAKKRFSMKQCFRLSRCPRDLLEAIFSWKGRLALTASMVEELAESIASILKESGQDLSDFLKSSGALEIVDSESSTPQERTSAIRNLVEELRRPTVTGANRRIETIRSDMGLLESVRLEWDRSLEKRKVKVSIEIDAPGEWGKALEILGKERFALGVDKILNEL